MTSEVDARSVESFLMVAVRCVIVMGCCCGLLNDARFAKIAESLGYTAGRLSTHHLNNTLKNSSYHSLRPCLGAPLNTMPLNAQQSWRRQKMYGRFYRYYVFGAPLPMERLHGGHSLEQTG